METSEETSKNSVNIPDTVPITGVLEAQDQVSFQTVSIQDKSNIRKESQKLLVHDFFTFQKKK